MTPGNSLELFDTQFLAILTGASLRRRQPVQMRMQQEEL